MKKQTFLNSKRSARQDGFTLVELVVVVTVVGLLAALAVPRYIESVQKAQLAKQRTVIAAIEKAKDSYILDAFRGGAVVPAAFNAAATDDARVLQLRNYISTAGVTIPYSVADLVKGTGKVTADLHLGTIETGTVNSTRVAAYFSGN